MVSVVQNCVGSCIGQTCNRFLCKVLTTKTVNRIFIFTMLTAQILMEVTNPRESQGHASSYPLIVTRN